MRLAHVQAYRGDGELLRLLHGFGFDLEAPAHNGVTPRQVCISVHGEDKEHPVNSFFDQQDKKWEPGSEGSPHKNEQR